MRRIPFLALTAVLAAAAPLSAQDKVEWAATGRAFAETPTSIKAK